MFIECFFIFSTADAHLAAITTQNQNQSNQSKEPQTPSSTQNDDQNSSAGSVATTPEREVVPKAGKGNLEIIP